MASLLDWRSAGSDGEGCRAEFKGPGHQLPASVREVLVATTDGDLRVLVREGARAGVFTRRQQACAANGELVGAIEDTVVVEIVPDPERPDRYVRLYLGREIILSTEDLYG